MRNKIISRLLAFSDTHIPFMDLSVMDKIHKYNKKVKPDIVVHDGDTFDFPTFSRFEQDPRITYSFSECIEMGTDLFGQLRGNNKKARIIEKKGNHDERFDKYACRTAPELVKAGVIKGLPELLNFEKYRIEAHGYNDRLVLEGNLKITHGTIVAKKSGYSAHGELEKAGTCSGISGHTHRLGFVTYRGRTWMELGHLCTTDTSKFLYLADGEADWQQGFGVGNLVEFANGEKKWFLQPIEVVNNSFVIDGEVY